MLDKKSLFCLLYAALVVCILADTKNANSNYASFPANENGTCYKRVPYDEALAINISRGIIKTSPGSHQAGVKTNSNRGWVTILDCCDGFIRNESTGNCETHCEEGCFGGTCTGPNICTCEDGWRPEAGVCKPICRRGCAENSYCFSPDICTCKFGYEEEEGTCKPVCRHGCKNGQCVAPRDCRCNPGYFLNETQRCEPICEGGCPHGVCTEPGICECDHGYMNPESDREMCVPSCPDTCLSTYGQCHSPNVCTCSSGYTQTPSGTCIPECLGDCPNGQCVAPEQCKCNRGFVWNRQLRGCTEAPKGQDDYYENPAVNSSYKNNHNNPTVPPETLYGGRGTYRPEDSSQLGSDHSSKKPQYQRNYGNQQPGRAYGTQGFQNRNRPGSEVDAIYTSTEPSNVVGLNQTQNNSEFIGLNKAPHPHQNPSQSPNSNENYYPHSGYGNNSTATHRPPNNQGPFAPLGPYYPDNQRSNQTNQRNRNPSYETYGTSQSSRPPRPVNQQGPFPSQGYNDTHDLYGANRTNYGDHRYNQTQRPYQRPYSAQRPHGVHRPYSGQEPHPTQETFPTREPYSTEAPGQGLYPKLPPLPGQDPSSNQSPSPYPYDEQGPYRGPGSHSVQAPGHGLYPKLPRLPGQGPASTHDRHDFESSHEPHYNQPSQNPQNPNIPEGSNQPLKPHEPYGAPAHGQPGNPHEISGTKGPGRRPKPEPNRNPGLELAYGPNEMEHLPPNGNINLRPDQGSVIVGFYGPYNPPGNDGSDSIYVLEPTIYDPFLSPISLDPGFAPHNPYALPTCDMPCINSVCVGINMCQCKPGYVPDPRNPNGFKCVPTCPGGCINGVCSGPNLCICNAGFVKEHGVKGAGRCVPA